MSEQMTDMERTNRVCELADEYCRIVQEIACLQDAAPSTGDYRGPVDRDCVVGTAADGQQVQLRDLDPWARRRLLAFPALYAAVKQAVAAEDARRNPVLPNGRARKQRCAATVQEELRIAKIAADGVDVSDDDRSE